MPTAKLIGPRRMRIRDHLYIRGKEEPVTDEEAILLDDDPRFRVRGLNAVDRPAQSGQSLRPKGEDLYDAIAMEIGNLDESPDNYDAVGKPSWRAISAKLGYPITGNEVELAMRHMTGHRKNLEAAEAAPRSPVKSFRIKKAEAAPDPVAVARAAAQAGDLDPTTAGAI